MRRLKPLPRLLAGVAAVSLLLVAACSSSGNGKSTSSNSATDSSNTSATTSANNGGASGLKTGSVTIGTSADFAPMMVRDTSDPTKVEGFEYDMIVSLMKHLNQKFTMKISSFGGLIPAIQAAQLDMVVSDVYMTAERQKSVDFVPYMSSGLSVLVAAKNASNVHSYMDLCGKAIGVVTGSPSEVQAADAASKQCTDAGKSKLNVSSLPAVSDELAQIDNGRLFGIIEDSLSLAYVQTKQPGKYEVAFADPTTTIKIGIVLAKGSSLEAPLQNAVNWYLGTEDYKANAKKWGIPDSSLLTPSS